MPTYPHLQEAKKANSLPKAAGEMIGVCLTCKYWQADTPRPESLTAHLALCIYPQLKEYALIVSGSSGRNKWKEQSGAGAEAKAYAGRGEEK